MTVETGTVSLMLQEFVYILTSSQKSDHSYWNTLLQNTLEPGLLRLPTLTLCHQNLSRCCQKVPLSTKKALILFQSISRRILTLNIDANMTNKISTIKELGVLTHMPDGDSLTVSRHLIRLRKGLIEYRFSTKSSIWRVQNI